MNAEIYAALAQLEKERGIPQAYMMEKITQALVAAYKKDKTGYTDNVFVELTENDMRMYVQKEVVDGVITPATEISLEEARKINPRCELGDLVNVDVKTQNFGRIAAQTAKQVIIQGIREAERGMIFDSFSSKEHEILTGTVLRIEPQSGDMTIRIGTGNDRTDAYLAAGEQVKTEHFTEGDLIRVYVVEVRRSSRGPQVIVSRTHPGLVKRLFELNVPEIESGLVEIKSVAREAGSRTKLAVRAAEENIDPVGACVGPRGGRVGAVVDELRGEKMDIVVWSEDPEQFAGHQGLPCHRARRPALSCHRQGGPERPAGRPADRLQDRHQARLPGRGARDGGGACGRGLSAPSPEVGSCRRKFPCASAPDAEK